MSGSISDDDRKSVVSAKKYCAFLWHSPNISVYLRHKGNGNMEKNFLELVKKRYSCRAYENRPIEDEVLDYLMECVRMAPSAVNKQPWLFRIVRGVEREWLQLCYDREWFRSAPLYILATVRHDEEWVRADGVPHGRIDVAIAVEHLCLAATEQGLGSCWVCNFDAAMCSKLFALPSDEEPVAIIPLGYPADTPKTKIRKDIEEIRK